MFSIINFAIIFVKKTLLNLQHKLTDDMLPLIQLFLHYFESSPYVSFL